MYIPTIFFGAGDGCITAVGGDSTGEFYSGSAVWKWHKYTTTGSHEFTILTGSTTDAYVFLAGGGGGGGYTTNTNLVGTYKSAQIAGGGGGGGVVYAKLGLGKSTYNLYVGNGGLKNNNGEDSWIDLPFEPSTFTTSDGAFYPTSSFLTAEGGGHGAYVTFYQTASPFYPGGVVGQNGGSGGGGAWGSFVQAVDGSHPHYSFAGGNGRVAQGTDAGISLSDRDDFYLANGGGGAGGESQDVDDNFAVDYLGRAGNGKQFNVTGSLTYYSAGGAGTRVGVWESASLGNRTKGSGGYGSTDSNTPPGTAPYYNTNGIAGEIVIAYAVCPQQLTDCTTYTINGGGSGGIVTYIECGTTNLVSASIEIGEQATICTYVIDDYPSKTGTVVLTSSGSCSVNIPIEPFPTCDTGSGEVPTPMYIYNFETPSGCYPTPESCQSQFGASAVITYWDANGPVTYNFPGGFNNNSGTICAREFPTPTIECGSVAYQTGTCAIVKTNLVCNYYCSSSV